MFSTKRVRTLAAKVVAIGVLGGGLALGTSGAAFATTTTAGSTPGTTAVAHCARAPKALAKIQKVEAAVTKRLSKLQTAEKRFTAAHRTKAAGVVAKRIVRLHKAEAKGAALEAKIQAKCPSGSTS